MVRNNAYMLIHVPLFCVSCVYMQRFNCATKQTNTHMTMIKLTELFIISRCLIINPLPFERPRAALLTPPALHLIPRLSVSLDWTRLDFCSVSCAWFAMCYYTIILAKRNRGSSMDTEYKQKSIFDGQKRGKKAFEFESRRPQIHYQTR